MGASTEAESEPTDSVQRERTLGERILGQREFGVVVAVLLLIVLGTLNDAQTFLTLSNFVGVIRNAAVVSIIGYGMTLLITSGEFDLAVGSVMAISAGLAIQMFLSDFPFLFALVVVLLLAIIFGIVQGILVTKLGLPSLIVTIGTLTLLRGGHLIVTGNVTQTVPLGGTPTLLWLMGGVINMPFPVFVPFTDIQLFTIPAINYMVPFVHDSTQTFNSFPMQIFWVVVFLAIFHYVLFYTRFGYRTQATGGAERSARYSGVKTDQIKIANFGIVAFMAAFAGISQLAFTGNVSPLTGQGQELVVIAAVVIGGTDLFGGEGTMGGTVLGALVFAFTQNILVIAGFGTQLFAVFTGIFIILAVAVDALTRQARYEAVWRLFVDPLRRIVTDPRAYFRYVDEEVQGVDAPLGFVTMATIVWSIPALIDVILTFVPAKSPVIPGGFEVFIVDNNVQAFATLPLFTFSAMAIIGFLSLVFVHASARLFGGNGDIDDTVQVVGYSLAPSVLYFVPFVLVGHAGPPVLWLPVAGVLALVSLGLLYVGVGEIHELDTGRSAGVALVTIALWVLSLLWAVNQFPAPSG